MSTNVYICAVILDSTKSEHNIWHYFQTVSKKMRDLRCLLFFWTQNMNRISTALRKKNDGNKPR